MWTREINTMSGFFENLGRKLGRAAVPVYRKTKWVWDGLTGTDEEVDRAEAALGKAMATEIRLASEIVQNPELLNWIRGLCRRIQDSMNSQVFQFHCEIIETEFPSIIALPGGYLFVSRSLIGFCEGNSDELAFVIAHETAHVIRRHTWNRLIQQSALRAANFVTQRAGMLAGWVRQQGLPMLRNAYSMDLEFEADKDGLGLAQAAGFDPAGAIAFLRRSDRAGTDPEKVGEYLASHPPARERMERLKIG